MVAVLDRNCVIETPWRRELLRFDRAIVAPGARLEWEECAPGRFVDQRERGRVNAHLNRAIAHAREELEADMAWVS